jgi:hypothetical protein
MSQTVGRSAYPHPGRRHNASSIGTKIGMWAGTGLRAPLAMREVSPDAVADAVLRVLRGASEVLVTSGPIRPLLAIQELFPGLKAPMMARLGITAALEARSTRAAG